MTEPKYINLTPVGLQTPEGILRVEAARVKWDDAAHSLANHLTDFYQEMRDLYEERLSVESVVSLMEDMRGITDIMIEENNDAQEEFLRAIAGVPPRG